MRSIGHDRVRFPCAGSDGIGYLEIEGICCSATALAPRSHGAGLVLVFAATGMLLMRRSNELSNELVLYGNIDIREVDLAFNEGDRIVAMYAEEGDVVEEGRLLAELDASRLEHVVLAAEARVAAERAMVARFEHGSRPEEIKRARAEVVAAEADLTDARISHERQDELVKADIYRQLHHSSSSRGKTSDRRPLRLLPGR